MKSTSTFKKTICLGFLMTHLIFNASAQDSKLLIGNYLKQQQVNNGKRSSDQKEWVQTDSYVDHTTGLTYTYVNQQYHNIIVFNAVSVFAIKNNKIVHYTPDIIENVAEKVNSDKPSFSPEEAIHFAIRSLNKSEFSSAKLLSQDDKLNKYTFDLPEFSDRPIEVQLVYQPTENALILAWNVSIDMKNEINWWNIRIDALNGDFLEKNNYTVNENFDFSNQETNMDGGPANLVPASSGNPNKILSAGNPVYNIFPLPIEAPSFGIRQSITDAADPVASPFGWHDVNGAAGAEYTITNGNNVYAATDPNANDIPDYSPDGGPNFNFNFLFTAAATPITNRDASVSNLFYVNNKLHDILYHFGFNEASGNFQINNYGNGGLGNDQVKADGMDGEGLNNANFSTPTDGSAPRMQMFLFTGAPFQKDGSFDNGIIIHEYGHGLSNRLTGGPANSSCLNNLQSGGMGEGWSDYLALMMTLEPWDDGANARGMGTYVLGQPAGGSGIRRKQYSTNMSIDPLDLNAYGTSGTTPYGITRSTEVHNTGEIWCSALWDMSWNLIDDFGFDNTWTNTSSGNYIALRLVIQGMKLQPCNPGFMNARDAILNADTLLYGGIHSCRIWQAFARRGMGSNASQGASSNSTAVTPGYLIVTACNQPVAAFLSDVTSLSCSNTVNFKDKSQLASSYLWDFGDGNTSTDASPSHTYASAGTYIVRQTVTNPDGSNFIEHTILIAQDPVADFYVVDSTIMENENAVFKNLSSEACSYFMDFGDNTSSASFASTHTYTTAGDYIVKLVVTNPSRKDSITHLVHVDSLLIAANFYYDKTTINCGDSINFISTSINSTSWLWDFGDQSTSTLQNPSHRYSSPGTYSVKLVSYNDFEKDSITKEIIAQPAFTATATATPASVCAGDAVQLNVINSATVALQYTVSSISYSPVAGTGTAVTLTDDANSAFLPIGFDFSYSGNTYSQFKISSNGFISFNANPSTTNYGIAIPNSAAPNNFVAFAWADLYPPQAGNSINYFTTGSAPDRQLVLNYRNVFFGDKTKHVDLQVLLFEGSNNIEFHIDTINVPVGNNVVQGMENITGLSGIAIPGRNQTNFTANDEGWRFVSIPFSYSWLPGNLNGSAQSVSPAASTIYTVTINDGVGCIETFSTPEVAVNPLPTPVITGSLAFCGGGSTTLDAGTFASYSWSTGETTQTISVNTVATFTVTVTDGGGCTGTASATTIFANPVWSAPTVTQPSCATPTGTIVINATGIGTLEYSVDNGANWFPDAKFSGLAPGNYTIVVRLLSSPFCSTTYSGNPVALNATVGCCIIDPVVLNNSDAGPGSLRQAIIDACPGSTITFDMSTVVSPINLTSGELAINKNLTIQGPGANLLNVHNAVQPLGETRRVFNISNVITNISGITISGGSNSGYNNYSGLDGAGINNSGQLTITDCIISDNDITGCSNCGTFGNGAGINNGGTLTITNSIIKNNSVGYGGDFGSANGGGIANWGTAIIHNCTISQNESFEAGAGLYNGGTMTITNSTISNNNAGQGGGLYTSGSLTVTNTTFSSNSGRNGGAIIYTGGTAAIKSCTITGNSGYGGGIYNYTYDLGGGSVPAGVFTIGNSILAGNGNNYSGSEGADYYFPWDSSIPATGYANLTSLGHNIFGKVNEPHNWTFTGPGDQVGSYAAPINPLLGPLANNGGPTFTHALLSGSTAVNGGDNILAVNAGLTTDQRGPGFPRIGNGGTTVDIGAYEADNTTLAVIAVANNYATYINTTITRNTSDPDDLLDNDNLSSPLATITSFGGGSLGGTVTTNIAGASVSLAGGTLIVNSDGSFSLTTPTILGTYTFQYRLTNSSGSSDATVTIKVLKICPAPGTRWYVNASADPDGTGTSWDCAFQSLQTALAVASSGHEIWVAAGTYKPTTTTDRSKSFVMRNGIAIYGGFNGTETTLSQRNWTTNVSILSGDIGVPGVKTDNSISVIANKNNQLNNSAILDGFTITDGYHEANDFVSGGGMVNLADFYADIIAPTVSNCIFTGNTANRGGAIFNQNGAPKLTNCIFYGNVSYEEGSAILNYNNNPYNVSVTNCTFSGNTSNISGGTIYNASGTSTTMTNCIVWGNNSAIGNDIFISSSNINYSIIQGGCPAGSTCSNVQDVNPNFVSTNNLHLQGGSPAINAGTNTGAPSNDIERNTRPLTVANPADMGAYEFQCVVDPIVTNNNNIGPGSLRQAVIDACPGSTITFNMNPGFVVSPIVLTTFAIVIDKNLTIAGPGSNVLSISGNNHSNIFYVLGNDSANINDLTITNGRGSVGNAGGGIHNEGILDVKRCYFKGNTSGYGNGGAIFSSSASCKISDCTFESNSTIDYGGGAIYSSNNCSITRCTFKSNLASAGSGGAIRFDGGGDKLITNSTFTDNSSTGGGGAIYNTASSTTVTNCTFFNNKGDIFNINFKGGAIFHSAGSITVRNSIFAGNTPDNLNPGTGGQAGIPVTDGGGNLKSDNSGPASITQVTLAQLNLQAIGNNGGLTETIALGPNSLAINAGVNANAAALSTDQRGTGFPRIFPIAGNVDVGAFELQCPTITPIISGELNFCDGTTTLLDAGDFSSYNWSTNETTKNITVSTAETFTVTVTDANGCTGSASVTTTLKTKPIAQISGDISFCSGSSTQLCGNGGASAYLWSTGETSQCITVNDANNYSVTVTNGLGCTGSTTVTTIVKQNPTPTISGNLAFCEGSSTILDAGKSFAYHWSTDATTQTISVNTAGTFTVVVTESNGCTGSASVTTIVNANPVVTIDPEGSATICEGVPIDLTGNNSKLHITYPRDTLFFAGTAIFGPSITVTPVSGDIVYIQDLSHSYIGCSTYPPGSLAGKVALIDRGSCFFSSKALNAQNAGAIAVIIANNSPSGILYMSPLDPSITIPTISVSMADGLIIKNWINSGTVTGHSEVENFSYLWSTGETTQSITTTQAGTYSLTITDVNGCKGTGSTTISVNPAPQPIISGNTSFCSGSSTTLDAGAGYFDYLWSTGETTQTISVSTAGTFSVTVLDANFCSGSTSVTTTVNPKPTANISGSLSFCNGKTTALCANAGASSYLWSNNGTNQCITVGDANTYSVTITNQFGCTGSTSVTTIKNPNPTPSISGNLSFCSGSSTTLNAGVYAGYLWSTLTTTQTISVNTAATFSVVVTDGNGCTGSTSVTTSLKTYTIGAISGLAGVCAKQSGVVYCVTNPSPGILSYIWTLPTGVSAIGATNGVCITLKFSSKFKGGSICAKAVSPCGNTSNSCKNVVLITKAPNTPGTITGPATLCPNQIATYSIAAIPTATSYSWTVPSNLQIMSGQGGTSIVVKALSNFNSGYVKVRGMNCKDGSGTKSMILIKSKGCRVSAASSNESINETEILSGFNVYPNPTTGKITVNFISNSKSKYVLNVMDLVGKKILMNAVEAIEGENKTDFDLSHLAKGMYFITLEMEGMKVQPFRIVVE